MYETLTELVFILHRIVVLQFYHHPLENKKVGILTVTSMQLFSLIAPQQPKKAMKKMMAPRTMAVIGIIWKCHSGRFSIALNLSFTATPTPRSPNPATWNFKKQHTIYFITCSFLKSIKQYTIYAIFALFL